MSAATPSPGATQAAPLPSIVTQFSQPSECTNLFQLVSETTAVHTIISAPALTLTSALFTSDSSDNHFSSCQPSGWDKAHFTFSPGLCPSGWVYTSLWAMTTSTATVSQAYCCAPDYLLHGRSSDDTGTRQCQQVRNDGNQSQTRLHDAWLIKWQSSDKLPISLPNLPTGSIVYSWLPGQSAALSPVDGNESHHNSQYYQSMIAVIVIPIVVVALCTGFCAFCIIKSRRRKRRQELTGQVGKDGAAN